MDMPRTIIEPSDQLLAARHIRPNKRQQLRNEKILNLLNSTVRVLARDGHAGLSMRSVAAEAGVSLSSLQHYFETRDALVNEASRAFLIAYLERYTRFRLSSGLSAAAALEAILEDIFREVQKPEASAMYFEIWALARHDESVGRLVVEVYDQYVALFAELIRSMEPELAETHVQGIAMLIAAESEGLVVLAQHSSARGRSNGHLLAQMRQMWPAVIRHARQTQVRTIVADT